MSRYRRAHVEGGVFFFTVTLADRSSDVVVRHVDRLRRIYASIQKRYPFETVAICVLPDHLHAIWSLPEADTDFPLRWSLIKAGFSRGLPGERQRSTSKISRREGEFGSAVIGSAPFAMMPTWSATSTTFTSTP
jgi:putative transposase